MKIAFATAQSLHGSTNVGRIMPLAQEFTANGQECYILALKSPTPSISPSGRGRKNHEPVTPRIHYIGREPFRRTANGKERLKGLSLILNMLGTALRTTWTLHRIKPAVIIISKPLPANVLGVWLFTHSFGRSKIMLDTDDFELTANKLSSLAQRAVIHWSERMAAQVADTIVAASPFLADHFKQLTQSAKRVEVIATGIEASFLPPPASPAGRPLAPADRRTTIAYIGSISVSSGHRVDLLPEILQQTLAQNSQAHLLIAGDGDDVVALKEEFKRRNLASHVTWHGRFNSGELGELLSPTTIILDPIDDSIANRSKSSFRVTLAAALGLPVVTSNIGIRPELLPRQFHERFFAEPSEPKSYAEKSVALLQHPLSVTEREELQKHAHTYTWPELAARYHKQL